MSKQFRNLAGQIILEHSRVYDRLNLDSLEEFLEVIEKHYRIFTIGVGREGLATRAFTMRLMHMGKEVHWIWDDTCPAIREGDLLIATLGDGQIGHLHYICERAREAGAYVVIVTGSPSGKTAQNIANQVFFVPAAVYRGKDKVVESAQPMGNLFEQTLFVIFDMIIIMLEGRNEQISFAAMSEMHRNVE